MDDIIRAINKFRTDKAVFNNKQMMHAVGQGHNNGNQRNNKQKKILPVPLDTCFRKNNPDHQQKYREQTYCDVSKMLQCWIKYAKRIIKNLLNHTYDRPYQYAGGCQKKCIMNLLLPLHSQHETQNEHHHQ